MLEHRESPSRIARNRLHTELGRCITRLANEEDLDRRCDLADQAYDVLAILERLDGATNIAHPRGLRVIRDDAV